MGQRVLTWIDVYTRLTDAPPGTLWGVPRGGQIVAGLTGRAVDRIEDADVVVDDILDSGATRDRYVQQYGKPFWTLIDKRPGGDDWVVFPWEQQDTTTDIEDTVRRQLEYLGEDPTREGLRDTPRRVIAAWQELTSGMHQDPRASLQVQFHEACDEMVCVRGIPFVSLCEHHLMAFTGTATVAYIPTDNRIVGLSKLPRLVHCFARRLQTQERLTTQIAQTLYTTLQPKGVGVLLEAQHSCMSARGIRSPGTMRTSALLGAFRDDPRVRAEFLALATA